MKWLDKGIGGPGEVKGLLALGVLEEVSWNVRQWCQKMRCINLRLWRFSITVNKIYGGRKGLR